MKSLCAQLWQAAWKQFQLAPLIGTGSGTYFYYGRLLREPSMQHDPEHVHSDYLELLAEYGLIGAAALLAVLALHLRAGWRDFVVLRGAALWGTGVLPVTGVFLSNAAAINIGALAALASFVANSVVDFNLHIPVNALLLAWVCVTAVRNRNKSHSQCR